MFDNDNETFTIRGKGGKRKREICVSSVPRANDSSRGLSRQSTFISFHFITYF